MTTKAEKELVKNPQKVARYIDSLQKEKLDLQLKLQRRPSSRNYKIATDYVVYLLKRLNPNKRKTTNLIRNSLNCMSFTFLEAPMKKR